jgi:Rrf2 family protein
MHIPVKVDYGVRALVDLAMHRQNAPVRASEIASRTMIPEPYLAQVLHALGRAGMVRSQRGPHGGHALAVEPDEISLNTVMDCLGARENLVACLEDLKMCIHVPSCAQREVWQEVELAVYRILSSKTIGDLVDRSYVLTAGGASKPQPIAFRNNRN